jgi:hypothetical protein
MVEQIPLGKDQKNSMIPTMNKNRMRHATMLLVATGALLLSACASTPMTRIKDNPQIFNSLPTQYKNSVERGQLEVGMPPSAVFLAWGHPNSVSEGQVNGKSTVRWLYTSLKPVITPAPTFWGGGYWGPYPGFYRGYHYYNDVTYIPVNTGFVLFVNGKVNSWEKRSS